MYMTSCILNSLIESREEVGRPGPLCFSEVSHDVCLLLPEVSCLLKLQFALGVHKQKYTYHKVLYMTI